MRLNLLHKLENAHEDSVWTAAWAPGSDTLVTGSVDESVKLWREGAAGGGALEQAHQFGGVALGAVSVAADATGTYGAVTALDSSVSVWRFADYAPVGAGVAAAPSEAWGAAFLPAAGGGGRALLALAGGSSGAVRLVDVESGEDVWKAAVPVGEGRPRKERFVLAVATSPDGRRVAAGAMDGTVALLDAATGAVVAKLEGHFKPVRALAFTPDSRHLLTGCDDGAAHLYDAEAGALVEAFGGHEGWVLGVAPRPGGAGFATSCSDGRVRLFDLAARALLQTVADHGDQAWAVAWRADGARLASVSDDRAICVYDCA